MGMTTFSVCFSVVVVLYIVYGIIQLNRKNGLFDMTVFEMYLRKHHGMDNDQIDEEYDKYLKCRRELDGEIKKLCLTEDEARGAIVEYRKRNGYRL
jgi:hypothetical protein